MRQADLELGLDVQRLLNTTIRPLLNIDAGDIEITSVTDGRVELALLGACSRCCFRASCATYAVVDRIADEFGDRVASVRVLGLPVNRHAPSRRPASIPAGPAVTGAHR